MMKEDDDEVFQNSEKRKKRKIYKETAFKGYGLMKFDDYNYNAVNHLVFDMIKDNIDDKLNGTQTFEIDNQNKFQEY